MPETMSPREKVARIVDPLVFELALALDNAEGEPVALRRDATEMRDMRMSEAFSKADAILTALASGSGDHAELARLARKAREQMTCEATTDALCDGVDALLAENAALRAERDGMIEEVSRSQARLHAATEAGRKLAEADRLLDRAADLMRQCTDPDRFEGASTLNVYANMRAWLSDLPPAPGAEDE